MQGHTVASLTTLNRPGAWLLDYAFTIVRVLCNENQPSASDAVDSNACHTTILEWCFADILHTDHGSSPNNRGNQMETLAWLMLEADRPDLLLALAYCLVHTAHQDEGTETDSEPPDMQSLQQFLANMMAKGDAEEGAPAGVEGRAPPPRASPPAKAMPTRGPP